MVEAIVAVDKNWGIGKDNDLLISIPDDMKHFVQVTTGKTIIMGRNTWDSLPVKPLKNRKNIIITHSPSNIKKKYKINGNVYPMTMKDVKKLLDDSNESEHYVIIGGGQIYKELLYYCDMIHVTKIHEEFNADTFFPNLDEKSNFIISNATPLYICNHREIKYQFVTYARLDLQNKNKKIFIINGVGTSGKDTFVNLVSKFIQTWNYSSVDKIKEVASELGWHGGKTEKDRKFLSDLKLLCSEYNDLPMNCMIDVVKRFLFSKTLSFLFLHIREPKEIEKAKNLFNARTILIRRDSVKPITSNMADANVENYNYDFIIDNSGTLNDLEEKAKNFAETYRNA